MSKVVHFAKVLKIKNKVAPFFWGQNDDQFIIYYNCGQSNFNLFQLNIGNYCAKAKRSITIR